MSRKVNDIQVIGAYTTPASDMEAAKFLGVDRTSIFRKRKRLTEDGVPFEQTADNRHVVNNDKLKKMLTLK